MQQGNNAVVIGANFIGLLCARVLAERFASVTVLDTGTDSRTSPVPTLVAKVYRELDGLFPGIGTVLRERGALGIDWAREFRVFSSIGWGATATTPSRILSILCTKSLLEATVRDLVAERFSNVRFLDGISIFDINSGEGGTLDLTVTSTSGSLSLNADLVAVTEDDGAVERYLNGGETIPETSIDPNIHCLVRSYALYPGFPDFKAMLVRPQPGSRTKTACLGRVEGDRFVVALGEYGRDLSIDDDREILDFAAGLPTPEVREILERAEPLSPITVERVPPNRFRHFEGREVPGNLVVLGDPVCRISPFYAQDLSMHFLAVSLLGDFLRDGRPLGEFPSALADLYRLFWSLATNLDLCFETTTARSNGEVRPRGNGLVGGLVNWYSARFLTKTASDPSLYTLWLEVIHLLKPPTEFFRPEVVLKTLSP
jgi:2-polyprenyl-6-methoxyphenol hydroxylase-like FAD-dependent oxidoreductase